MTPEILYYRYLLGRLGAPEDLRGMPIDELCARALGELGRSGPIYNAWQVSTSVNGLIPSAPPNTAPQAQPESPSTPPKAKRRASGRVAEMLAKLGVDESALTDCNRSTKHDSHSAAARRALVGKLASEGLSAAKIARELGIDPSTVRGHLRALRGK
jgi:DNA-binding CsgD family transcriptional regulator